MTGAPWRVTLISGVAPIATALADRVRELGHEPVALLTPRRRRPMEGPLAISDATVPSGLDLLFARDARSLAPLMLASRPDLALCFGFPWLIPPDALEIPPLGIVNLHPALLPRHRGPFPVAWAIRDGDPHYGVTWHRMDGAYDSGGILAQAPVPMEADDTEITVVGPRLLRVACELLPGVLERIAARDPGDRQVVTGDEPYAHPFGDDYREIDWTRPAQDIHRQVRAWVFASLTGTQRGPTTTLGGRRVVVKRTSLVDPGAMDGVVRAEAADGPLWILDTDGAEETGSSA